jgi:hypothetical protein
MTDDEYQTHMDGLAQKVGNTLAGERIEDAAIACAACIGFGLLQLKPEHRTVLRKQINVMIEKIVDLPRRPTQ